MKRKKNMNCLDPHHGNKSYVVSLITFSNLWFYLYSFIKSILIGITQFHKKMGLNCLFFDSCLLVLFLTISSYFKLFQNKDEV